MTTIADTMDADRGAGGRATKSLAVRMSGVYAVCRCRLDTIADRLKDLFWSVLRAVLGSVTALVVSGALYGVGMIDLLTLQLIVVLGLLYSIVY